MGEIRAIRRTVRSGVGAIGVGARHDDDIDLLQQGLKQSARRKLARDDQQGLGRGRFVAMLLADEHDRRQAGCIDRCCLDACRSGGNQGFDGEGTLGQAYGSDAQAGLRVGGGGDFPEPSRELRIRRELPALLGQARCVIAHCRIGKAACNGLAIGGAIASQIAHLRRYRSACDSARSGRLRSRSRRLGARGLA